MKDAIIIPIRGLKYSMSRLRSNISEKLVEKLVQDLFERTITAINHIDLPIIILTADRELKEIYPDFSYIFDEGAGLNQALAKMTIETNFDRYLMIMPDLPLISKIEIDKIIHLSSHFNSIIVNTEDKGTAMCLLPPQYFRLKLFGKNSSEKIIEQAISDRLEISKLEIKSLLKDLDTIDDYNFWIQENKIKVI